MSIATQRLLTLLMGWTLVVALCIVSLVYRQDISRVALAALGVSDYTYRTGDRTGGADAPSRTASGGRVVELRAGSGGHFFSAAEINGRRIDVMVDTGATMVALTFDDAVRAGLTPRDSDFTQRVNTANGFARVAPVILGRVEIDGVVVRDVHASISEPGRLTTTLLGMSFLGKLKRVEMKSGRLVLEE